MTGTSHRPLAEPLATGVPWLARALVASAVLHALVAAAWWLSTRPARTRDVEVIDIEVAPPPPKAEALPPEVARPPESSPEALAAPAAAPEEPTEPTELAARDAGVDAPIDAPADAPRRRKPDAAIDAAAPMITADLLDAGVAIDSDAAAMIAGDPHDGGALAGGDAGSAVAALEPGAGSGSGPGPGGELSPGAPAAIAAGSGSGVPGTDTLPAVDGAPTTAGTAANLLAYFPPGHVVTALVRFDRLRQTEWKDPVARLFKPMPDHAALFGARDVALADSFDTLVISSPRPRDATATTLVVRTSLTRPRLRDFLANPDAPIQWSAARGGMLGKRTGKVFPRDRRVLLAPWRQWVVLAQPEDLGALAAPATGNLDTIEARAKLPPWLAGIRAIEPESGEGTRGPALVLTLGEDLGPLAPGRTPVRRYTIPDVGLGVTSLPAPQRISLAMEVVAQGWLVRGNIVFASEPDAVEFVEAVQQMQQRVIDSRVLSRLLERQKALNVVTGLSLARTGARVSYATSMSIADTRALLAAAAIALEQYFGQPAP